MLTALKNQLESLAETDKENFHVLLRSKVGKKATAILEERLIDIIVLMPDLVSRIYHHWNKSHPQSQVKNLSGYLLTYLYTPEDFLSTKEWGLFGYLDDSYFVAKVFTAVIEEMKSSAIRTEGIDEKYYEHAKYLKRYVRGVIPEATQKIDRMIAELETGNNQLFQEIFK